MEKPKSRVRKQQPENPKKRRPQPDREAERPPVTVFEQDEGVDYDDWEVDDSELRNRW